jgi:hypothetical protein
MARLRTRLDLVETDRDTLNDLSTKYHYMHRAVHQRSCPFGWQVALDGHAALNSMPCGFIIFASIHFTCLSGEFGYPGLPTKWQVLSLARLWLHDDLPKFSATCVIGKALKLVQRRWLDVHPPRYLDEPYHILKVLSYADTRYHEGTIYRAANFRESGRTISQKRHKNSRGPGMGETELIRFIYDLKKPNWEYEPAQLGLWTTAPRPARGT